MSSELVLYLIDVFGSASNMLSAIWLLLVVISIITCMASLIGSDVCDTSFEESLCYKLLIQWKNHILKFIFLTLIIIIIPSQKTMYLMLGANYLKNSSLPSKVELAVEKKIDEYLKEEKK